MATLTADEIEYIRAMSGDVCEPYDVGAEFLQKLWDKSGSDDCATIVYVLRVREAKSAVLVNQSNGQTGESMSLSSKHTQLVAQRQQWEERCGMAGGMVTAGAYDLRLDTDCTDLDEYAYFSRLGCLS